MFVMCLCHSTTCKNFFENKWPGKGSLCNKWYALPVLTSAPSSYGSYRVVASIAYLFIKLLLIYLTDWEKCLRAVFRVGGNMNIAFNHGAYWFCVGFCLLGKSIEINA